MAEIASLTFGLLPIMEKSFQIWKSLADAQAFGADMAGIVARLSMEFYRFHAWAKLSGIAMDATGGPISKPSALDSEDIGQILSVSNVANLDIEAQTRNAVVSILTALITVEKVVQKYKNKAPSTSISNEVISSTVASETLSLSTFLTGFESQPSQHIARAVVKRKNTEQILQRRTALKSRFTFSSKPWGTSDKEQLQRKVEELTYWNDRLEKLLPQRTKRTITEQAVPGQVLRDENEGVLEELIKAAEHENVAVRTHAQLWRERLSFRGDLRHNNEMIVKYRISGFTLEPVAYHGERNTKLRFYKYTDKNRVASKLVAVEDYPYGSHAWSNEDANLAIARLSKIIYLTSYPSTPPSLRLLKSLGFVEGKESIRLVYEIPKDSSETYSPVTLHSLLAANHNVKNFRKPSLETRIELAKQVASAVYSFMLVRWFHKDLKPHNIVFFRSKSSGRVLIDSPYIVGFSVARSDTENEKSLNKLCDSQDTYLHHSLRVDWPDERPRYHRRFEVWSLGILLLEIGLWKPLDIIGGPKKDANKEDFGKYVRQRAESDLPFYVGDTYQKAVSRCLEIGNDEDSDGEEIGAVYWNVILELAKCL